MSVPCQQKHGKEILFTLIIVDFLTKLSIYIFFYIIEKLNVSEIKTENTCSV